MKEIVSLRKLHAASAKGIARLEQRIAEERVSVDQGGSLRELRLLEQDLDDERARLETLERRIAVIEGEEGRERNIARLVELDQIVEEARAQVAVGRQEANDTIDSVVRQQFLKESALAAAEQEFLGLATHLAPIHGFTHEERARSEALREELRARGAKLRAIGMTRSGQHAFTIGGGGDGPWPGLWGIQLHQMVQGWSQKQSVDAYNAARSVEPLATGASA
jgi:hypothetical protein